MDSSTYLHPLDPTQTASIWCFLQVSVVAPSTMVTPWQAIGTGRRASEGNYVFSPNLSLLLASHKVAGPLRGPRDPGPAQREQASHREAKHFTIRLDLSQ